MVNISVLFLIIIFSYFGYSRLYIRKKQFEYKIVLLHSSGIIVRYSNAILISVVLLIYLKLMTIINLGDLKLIVIHLMVLNWIIMVIMSLQSELITELAIFTETGNYYFSKMNSYHWNINDDEVGYSELVVNMNSKNKIESMYRGANYEVVMRVKKEDFEIADKLINEKMNSIVG